MTEGFEEQDRDFEEYLAKNPHGTFSQFSVAQQAREIAEGVPHATLGPRLVKGDDWWEAGAATYMRLGKLLKPEPSMRIVDYGCGSMRVGAHFIRDHDPGCYFGLDVTSDFYEYGKELVGADLMRKKQPRVETITRESVRAAAEFEPDIVISTACAFHVHPDEKTTYVRNILSVAHRQGARFAFDTVLTPQLLRYNDAGWGRPLSFYTQALAPMVLQPERLTTPFERNGHRMEYAYLVFRR